MIYQIDILDPSQTPVAWLPKVEALGKPRTFEFKPGLNVLWGRNGSGKTTLTKLLARLFHCEQGNHPTVSQESLAALVGDRFHPIDVAKGVAVKHDGQGVRHFDPGHAVGLTAGGAAFDWDFGTEGIYNQLFKGSAGQTTMYRFDRILNEVVAGEVPEIEYKLQRDRVADVWKDRIDLARRILKKNAPEGQPTILLDEPERSYDLNAQVGVWRLLRAYAADVQFIVASHSLFALKIPDAHYVELSPRYLADSNTVLDILGKWPSEKPKKVPEAEAKKARQAVKKRRESR
ncbi:MAG TPA: ATP-binding cassette domain-containing protein [Gaiellaceae bacterium]|nr:ATP-binding cassette domain-containing protein [Gaiellaceae bacterium]